MPPSLWALFSSESLVCLFVFSALVFVSCQNPRSKAMIPLLFHPLDHIFKETSFMRNARKHIFLWFGICDLILTSPREELYWPSHLPGSGRSVLQITLEDTYMSFFFLWKAHFNLSIWKIFKKNLESSASLEGSHFLFLSSFWKLFFSLAFEMWGRSSPGELSSFCQLLPVKDVRESKPFRTCS